MARRNEEYTPEMREQTAAYILESGKSATKTAKEMGIDVNTVCRWVQDYRKKLNLPSLKLPPFFVQRCTMNTGPIIRKKDEYSELSLDDRRNLLGYFQLCS